MNLSKATSVLKAMANIKRLEILILLSDSEKSVGALLEKINLTQSALSQHLAVLRKVGILKTKRRAQKIFYILEDADIKKILSLLEQKNDKDNMACRNSFSPSATGTNFLRNVRTPQSDDGRMDGDYFL